MPYATSTLRFESHRRVITSIAAFAEAVPGIPAERLRAAATVAAQFAFRVPRYYVERVLSGPSDPLLDLVLPEAGELDDGDELWDATQSAFRVSESAFWIQKYEFQALLRMTTVCSGLCRFCYLKRKTQNRSILTQPELERILADIGARGTALQDLILSGGDPLCAPPDVLDTLARGLETLRSATGRATPYVSIHTREPVWDPVALADRKPLWAAMRALRPKAIMLNVVHPREATDEFLEVCTHLARDTGAQLLCQHPVFRGVNDSVEVLEELYVRLASASPPILPYYMVHPFYNGTLPKHKLSIRETQSIFRQLSRHPGWLTPKLVVPTPVGKCVVGPHDVLQKVEGGYLLHTKNGDPAVVP